MDWPRDYSTLDTKRRRQCCSCGEWINVGSTVVAFPRFKVPEHDIELAIYGETDENGPKRATEYLCERCGDLFFSLEELGFCVSYAQDMRELVKEYAEVYGKEANQ